MGFRIVEDTPRLRWVPVEPAETLYMGSIVCTDIATPLEGVRPMPVAVGASNTTNKDIPLGIVVGFNIPASRLAYSSTYKAEYATQVAAGTPYGATTSYTNLEGVWSKGDKQLYALIAEITPMSVIEGRIFNAAVGTAPTVGVVSTASGGDGIGCTTSAVDATTVANFATMYVRTGANRGIYRTLTSASTTTHTWLKAMPGEFAVGDQLVAINGLRPYGTCRAYIDSEALYIDASAALSANYLLIDVVELDLSEAGGEKVRFRFNMDNFCAARA